MESEGEKEREIGGDSSFSRHCINTAAFALFVLAFLLGEMHRYSQS